jgi:hypothetical protein
MESAAGAFGIGDAVRQQHLHPGKRIGGDIPATET